MSTNIEQQIWEIADRMRSESPITPSGIIELCYKDGIEINSVSLRFILSRFGLKGEDELLVPFEVTRFMIRIAEARSPQRVLDPSAGLGFVASPANAILKPEVFDAYAKSQFAANVWARLSNAQGINFNFGDGLASLVDDQDARYDAILSCPPFGMNTRGPQEVPINGQLRQVRAEYAHLLALASCLRLRENGIAVFVVTNSFFLDRKNGVKRLLAEAGFSVTAAIEVAAGSFAPRTNIPTHIVTIEKSQSEQIFTGRISQDNTHNQALFENLIKRKHGKTPEQGLLVEGDRFRGFHADELSRNLIRAAKRQGLVPHSIDDVVLEVHTPTSTSFEGYEDQPNAVYLPQMATMQATTCQPDFPEKLKYYFQLIVDPSIVSADFLAGLFNTAFGQLWRGSLSSGSTMARMPKSALEAADIYLPEDCGIELQQEVIECQDRLSLLTVEIRELETRLWQRPAAVKALEKQVNTINREDRYEDWVETLPFPLASILWSCHTQTGSSKEQYERKLHFFEALAEFIGVVHMSAYSANEGLWQDSQKQLNAALDQGKVSLERATFGTWAIIAGFFGKKSRGLLAKEADLVFELYKTSSRELLQTLFSKKLVTILQEVNNVRNNFSGHVGAMSDRDAAQVNDSLKSKIQAVREIFGIVWEDFRLILPEDCRFTDAGFEYKAKIITGTRTPFRSDTFHTTEPMKDGSLYLISPDHTRGLKLLPFVKVLPSPKTEENACYFYNRRDAQGVRFLSYYFEGDAEVIGEFGDVASALVKLGTP
ncbi:MAG: N-6 DNA methylase [Opitutae bacterium]|nr:N-6 DNA methylase [Opitutae bacterium]